MWRAMTTGDVPPGVAAAYERARQSGFALSCEPEVGRLLATLATAVPEHGAILEMGTGVGVGSAWIVHGLGARRDVRVTTIDVDAQASAIAQGGVWPPFVSLLVADVLAVLDDIAPFDLIFADAQGGKWTGLERTIAALRPGGLLLVDDMTPPTWLDDAHRTHTERVRAKLLGDAQLTSVELACGSGMILAARRF